MQATDRIDYTRPFAENVQGTFYARFRLDADGAPMYEIAGYQDGPARYYKIDVYLHSTKSDAITSVHYALDDGEAVKVLGRSEDRHNDFRATIESAGDVLLLIQVWMGPLGSLRKYEQRAWLSQMLENGYDKEPSSEVTSAILRIKVN